MIFHENRLLADDSHVISYLIFVQNWERCRKNLSSAAVVIGALRNKQRNLSVKLFKHLFWVLKRTASLMPFFLEPITYVLVEKYENKYLIMQFNPKLIIKT